MAGEKIYLNNVDDIALVQSGSGALTISGTNTYTAGTTPALTAYVVGQPFLCTFTNGNTAAATLNIDGLGAKTIKRNGSIPLRAKDIIANQTFELVYDGTDFQITGRVSTTGGWQRTFYPYNMVAATAAWVWNSVTLDGGPGSATLSNRTLFSAFGGANAGGGEQEGEFVNFALPDNYLAGEDIKITVIHTDSSGTGTDYKFNFGLGRPNGSSFATSTTTEWLSRTTTVTTGFDILSYELVFDGTNMLPGDPLTFMIYRDSNDAADTFTGDAYINCVLIQQA